MRRAPCTHITLAQLPAAAAPGSLRVAAALAGGRACVRALEAVPECCGHVLLAATDAARSLGQGSP